jgi:hypothetical protein
MKKAKLKARLAEAEARAARLAEAEARAARLARGMHKLEQLQPGGTIEVYHRAVQLILDEALGNIRHANRVLREVYEPALRAQLTETALFAREVLR